MHAAVCDFIIDCLQNSVEAESSIISLDYENIGPVIKTVIEDNGKGMTESELEKIRDPFYTSREKHIKRKVGLGIPFLIHAVNQSGGCFDIKSEKGTGTRLEFSFDTDNIDSPPEGNLITSVIQAMMFDGEYELVFKRTISQDGINKNYYIAKRSELLDALGDLENAGNIKLARQYLESQEEYLKKEAVNG